MVLIGSIIGSDITLHQRQRSPDGALCATYGGTPCSAPFVRLSAFEIIWYSVTST